MKKIIFPKHPSLVEVVLKSQRYCRSNTGSNIQNIRLFDLPSFPRDLNKKEIKLMSSTLSHGFHSLSLNNCYKGIGGSDSKPRAQFLPIT